jgi:hypothetical protein
MLRKFCEKKDFVQKCDEIRRFDGIWFQNWKANQFKLLVLPLFFPVHKNRDSTFFRSEGHRGGTDLG